MRDNIYIYIMFLKYALCMSVYMLCNLFSSCEVIFGLVTELLLCEITQSDIIDFNL